MCFPQQIKMPAMPRPPSRSDAQVQRRMDDATKPQPGMATVLTSPLGDPNFGKALNRTVLTGVL